MSPARRIKIRIADLAKLRAIAENELPRGSLLIASPQQLPPGTEVAAVLILPNSQSEVELSGVVEPSQGGSGIQIRLADATQAIARIGAYLRSTDESERREAGRVQTRARIRLRYADAKQFEEAFTHEVSLGGLFVPTSTPIDHGSTVDIVFLTDGGDFELSGRVVHTQPRAGRPGMGIQFEKVPAEVRARVEAYLRRVALGEARDVGRRESTRVATRATIRLRPKTVRRFAEMVAQDISRGGTFVATPKCFPVGTQVSVVFISPAVAVERRLEVKIDATVVRTVSVEESSGSGASAGMGLEFAPLSPEERAAIDAIVAEALGSATAGPAQALETSSERLPLAAADEVSLVTPAPRSGVTPLPTQESTATPVPAGPAGANRRTDVRIDSRARVVMSFGSVGDFQTAFTRDISKGGAFIVTEDPLPVMSQLEVMLTPPGGGDGVTLNADVVHVVGPAECRRPGDQPGMGVRFRDMTPEKRRAIEGFLGTLTGGVAGSGQGQGGTAAGEKTPKPKSVQQQRAEEFFSLAKQCIARGDRAAAVRNLQLATTFDPSEERYRALLRELRNQ